MANWAAIVPWSLLGLVAVILIILFATGVLHTGKSSGTTPPTNEQIVSALQQGVTLTATDTNNVGYRTVLTLQNTTTPGIGLNLTSSMTQSGTPIADIGGNQMQFQLSPGSTNGTTTIQPGATYVITNTTTSKKITVPPNMNESSVATPFPNTR